MLGLTLTMIAGMQALSIAPPRTAIAPHPPRTLTMRKPPTRISRVRGWTVRQRICDKRTEGKCVTTAPDLVQAEADKPRD